MKKVLVTIISASLLFSSCDTYTGASIGSVFGGAIGGIMDGHRGSDIGTLIGMVGGAAVGAAVEKASLERTSEPAIIPCSDTYEGYENYPPNYSSVESVGRYIGFPNVTIANVHFIDENQDGELDRRESGKIIFEVTNNGDQPLFDVVPSILETTQKKHIYLSSPTRIESIEPGQRIRYTAMVKADKKLKQGYAKFAITILQGRKSISRVVDIVVPTKK